MRRLHAAPELAAVALADADVSLLPHLDFRIPDDEVFARLHREIAWRHRAVTVWGKARLQPRLTAWYGDPGKSYAYSGAVMHPLGWTELLLALKDAVEGVAGHSFNSVLLNLYRDQQDSMGMHSDNEASLGEQPVIASLSYGAPRTLAFRHKRDRALAAVRLPLPSGSLLLMRGDTQRNWNHGVAKQTRPCGPRINLTFRTIVATPDGPSSAPRASSGRRSGHAG